MTDISFLDELATTQAAHQPTNEHTAEDTVSNDENATENVGPDTSVSAQDAQSAPSGDGDENTSKYPNVSAVYATRDEVPEDVNLYTVAEFSARLTVRNVTERNLGIDGIVKDSAVYTAMRALRHPLPVVLVGETALLGDEAFQAWDARPARGEGTTSTGGRLSDEDLLKAADKARNDVDSLNRRLNSLKARLDKADKLQTKRERQLSERFAGLDTDALWAKVDEWAAAQEVEMTEQAA